MSSASVPLLDVRKLGAQYGPTPVLHGIDFAVAEGGITAILGVASTLLAIPLLGCSDREARRGIAHVPDGRGTFMNLSVEDNLRLGAYTRRDRAEVAGDCERMYAHFPRLKERRRQQAGTLSGGEQQMLAVSRALMLRPRLLLLDEPSFGLAPLIVQQLFGILRAINQSEKIGMLLVEQNASMALALADQAYLLETGRVVMSGPAETIRNDEQVRRSYLGY